MAVSHIFILVVYGHLILVPFSENSSKTAVRAKSLVYKVLEQVPRVNKYMLIRNRKTDQMHTVERWAENIAFMIATYLKGH